MEKPPKILVIDDEEAARYGIGRALANQNYDIQMASNGAEGLQLASSFQPDVIMSDINMPQMDGITLLRHVKTLPDAPPVILITAYGSEEIAIDALRAGAYDYIHKPFEIDELRAILRNAIQHQQLVQQNRDYYARLERALAELRQSQAALVQSEKTASLAALVAGIAHELHTPLGVMVSSADTITRAAAHLDGGRERSREAIESGTAQLREACTRVREIVSKLRDFAQLDRAEVAHIDPRQSIEAALHLLEHDLAGINVEKEYGEIPSIDCYPRELNQLWMNLLLNAIQAVSRASEPGRIRIIAAASEISSRPAVKVRILDNGPGIAPEILNTIFSPSFTMKEGRVGVGFGLAICYRIVESHGGTLEARNPAGAGAELIVTLPVKMPGVSAS